VLVRWVPAVLLSLRYGGRDRGRIELSIFADKEKDVPLSNHSFARMLSTISLNQERDQQGGGEDSDREERMV